MAITDYDAYQVRLASAWQQMGFSKGSITTTAGNLHSLWIVGGGFPAGGAAPGAAAVCTRATTGALGQLNSATVQRLLKLTGSMVAGSGTLIIADRCAASGGMGATVTPQNNNGTVSAVARYPSGVGVMASCEIYTTIGATATTASVTMTTDTGAVGSLGSTSDTFAFGGTGNNAQCRAIPIPLPAGAKGVKEIATFNITASTGTAGSYGGTLYYPYVQIPLSMPLDGEPIFAEGLWDFGAWFPSIPTDACLAAYVITNGASTGFLNCAINLAED